MARFLTRRFVENPIILFFPAPLQRLDYNVGRFYFNMLQLALSSGNKKKKSLKKKS